MKHHCVISWYFSDTVCCIHYAKLWRRGKNKPIWDCPGHARAIKYIPSNLQYKMHQIPKHKYFSSRLAVSPCGCRDLSVRLGSRISPQRHRVVVEVHWRGAQGWRSISWVVATFSHVGGSFNLSMAANGDVWIIPSFRIWGCVLHVEHISCVITNCGQIQWAIPSLFSIAL